MKSSGRITSELRRLMADSYDVCRSCAGPLERKIAAYAGYDEHGTPLYVGDCCAEKICELATHVYWWWEFDKRVSGETVLWRYMDFAKLVDIVQKRSLHFSRADKLGDPFEGASGNSDRKAIWDAHYSSFYKEALRSIPGDVSAQVSDQEIETDAQRLMQDFRDIIERERQRTFVSCWHANLIESEALWRIYCPPPAAGIAIKTTADNFRKGLGERSDIKIGCVQYVDYRTDFAGFHDRIFWKRKSLSHEAEVRAVIYKDFENDDTGLSLPVDISQLLLAIVPSPFAPSWFADTLESFVRRAGLNVPIQKSELLAQPFF